MSLGFNGQNFQVPSRTLNQVATVLIVQSVWFQTTPLDSYSANDTSSFFCI